MWRVPSGIGTPRFSRGPTPLNPCAKPMGFPISDADGSPFSAMPISVHTGLRVIGSFVCLRSPLQWLANRSNTQRLVRAISVFNAAIGAFVGMVRALWTNGVTTVLGGRKSGSTVPLLVLRLLRTKRKSRNMLHGGLIAPAVSMYSNCACVCTSLHTGHRWRHLGGRFVLPALGRVRVDGDSRSSVICTHVRIAH